jgi:hypothetical protein
MRALIHEVRMFLAEWLLLWACRIAPKKSREGQTLLGLAHSYIAAIREVKRAA